MAISEYARQSVERVDVDGRLEGLAVDALGFFLDALLSASMATRSMSRRRPLAAS